MLSWAAAYFFCFSSCTPTTSRATRLDLSIGQDPFGELDRLIDVAVGDRGDEGAVEQFVVLRIGAQRGAVERRGGGRVALDAGMAGGEIAARHGQRLQIVAGRKLRRRHRGGRDDRASAPGIEPGSAIAARARRQGPAIATNGKHHGSLWLLRNFGSFRMSDRCGSIWKRHWRDNAAFAAQPQGSGRHLIRHRTPRPYPRTAPVWPYRGRRQRHRP